MENPVLKDYIVNDIIKVVENKGFNIDKVYVEHFIENFQEEYNRLPKRNEVKSIARSYIKMIETEDEDQLIDEPIEEERSLSEQIEPVIKDFIKKKNLIKSIVHRPIYKFSGKIISIPKPEGRRVCPTCNESWFKIHEMVDKSNIICHYPRLYGKKYKCDNCGVEWRER